MTLVHICAPSPIEKSIDYRYCHDCKRNGWFVSFYYEWYGPDCTCLFCGRHWSDGEWMPLDFVRGSRQKSVASAKRRWRETAVSEESS